MIESNRLEGVQRAIRKYLVLDDEDPVDRVLLASILANFAPDRDVPVWLVIVGDPASGKTDLISLIQDWRYTWNLPDVLTPAYFFSAKTGHQSALERLQQGDYRLLYSQDMGGLMGLNRLYASEIVQQLRGVHDGFLRKETGYDSRPQTYGEKTQTIGANGEPVFTPVPPAKRFGWIGSATPEFYPWQTHHNRLGTRFTCYLFQPFTDWLDFKSLTRIEQARAEKRHHHAQAKTVVQNFLDHVIANMGDFESLRANEQQSDRIAAVVKLVNRIVGTRSVTDTGARLHPRIVSVCRMMAYMAGKRVLGDEEIRIGMRLAMSQLPLDEHKIIRYALSRSDAFPMKDLLKATGLTRRQAERPLENMTDVGVLQQEGSAGRHGYVFAASGSTRQLAKVFSARA